MELVDEVEFEEHPDRRLARLTVREGKVIKTVAVIRTEDRDRD